MTALKLLMAETQSKASWPKVIAENERLRSQLAEAQADIHRFQAALSEALAEKARLEAQLTEAQAIIACLQAENNRLQQELTEVKRAPFKSRRRRQPKGEESATPKRRGRAKGHPGSGRKRLSRIDRTERILAGETCPDCSAPFTGRVIERERVVEDDELLVWLRNPAVNADNNEAERTLRPAVVTQKTSFGSFSKRGAQNFARLLFLIQTWERQGKDFFTTACDALGSDPSQN